MATVSHASGSPARACRGADAGQQGCWSPLETAPGSPSGNSGGRVSNTGRERKKCQFAAGESRKGAVLTDRARPPRGCGGVRSCSSLSSLPAALRWLSTGCFSSFEGTDPVENWKVVGPFPGGGDRMTPVPVCRGRRGFLCSALAPGRFLPALQAPRALPAPPGPHSPPAGRFGLRNLPSFIHLLKKMRCVGAGLKKLAFSETR